MSKPEKWIIAHCQERVERRWGKCARDNLGDVQYEAALNSELLLLGCSQAEEIDPARIVEVMRIGRTQIIDLMHPEEEEA